MKMSANGSFSSSSTLSYYSANEVDSNLDSHSDIFEELSRTQSGLYDIFVELFIEIPKNETFNKPDMVRAAVYTICGEIFFKYQQWIAISSLIAHHMGRALNPTSSDWASVKDGRLVYLGKTKITGHTLAVIDSPKLPIVHDSISYDDNICATNVRLNYSIDFLLTPGVAAAARIYKNHGFRIDFDGYSYKQKHMDDIMKGHVAEKLEVYNHHLAWSSVYNVLQEYRENVDKQNKFFEEYGFTF
ncbi:uncharacterized protein LOC107047730 [Diachasma alloeum]|uniref:uncharacterized protein LOC107047730 n=1 Tax=Diachasma alloeum TaxID=454923 RepID=UPI0007382DAD|nr:uncharacterized protein LOC107047730 [Diachasma alloeum]